MTLSRQNYPVVQETIITSSSSDVLYEIGVRFEFFDNPDYLGVYYVIDNQRGEDLSQSGYVYEVIDGVATIKVTVPAGTPAGSKIVVYRKVSNEQGTNFTYQSLSADTTEDAFDKVHALIQDNDRWRNALRCERSEAVEETALELPSSSYRADKILGFNSGGRVSVTSFEGYWQGSEGKRALDQAVADLDVAEGKIDVLQADMSQAQDDIEVAEGEIDTLQAEMTVAKSDIGVLQGEMDAVEGRAGIAETEIDTLQADMDQAESDIDTLQWQMTQAKTDIDRAEEKIVLLTSDMVQAKTDIDGAEKKIILLTSDMVQAKTDIDRVEGDIEAAEKDLLAYKINVADHFLSLDNGLFDTSNAVDRLEGEVDALQTKVGQAESDIDTLQTKVTQAESDIDVAEAEIDTLQADMSQAKADIAALGGGGGGASALRVLDFTLKLKVAGLWDAEMYALSSNINDPDVLGSITLEAFREKYHSGAFFQYYPILESNFGTDRFMAAWNTCDLATLENASLVEDVYFEDPRFNGRARRSDSSPVPDHVYYWVRMYY